MCDDTIHKRHALGIQLECIDRSRCKPRTVCGVCVCLLWMCVCASFRVIWTERKDFNFSSVSSPSVRSPFVLLSSADAYLHISSAYSNIVEWKKTDFPEEHAEEMKCQSLKLKDFILFSFQSFFLFFFPRCQLVFHSSVVRGDIWRAVTLCAHWVDEK